MITQTALKIPILAIAVMAFGLISACSSQAPSSTARPPQEKRVVYRQSIGEKAAAVAIEQVGIPYRYGGATTSGFDCSGLVQFSYGQAGKTVPRTTGQLWSATKSVGRENLQVGDLLFFNIEGKMSHVGMYVGGQRFVHAPSSGRTVSIATLAAPFYDSAFIRGGRP